KDCGCGIRVILDKRIGYSYATTMELSSVKQAVKNAISLARISSRDVDFFDLPSSSDTYPEVSGLYDEDICNLEPEEAVDLLMRAVQTNHEHLEHFTPLNFATLQSKELTRAITNSNELVCSSESTYIAMALDATIRKDGQQGNSWEFQQSTQMNGIDPEGLGRKTAEYVLETLDAAQIEGGRMPVILSPHAVSHLISSRRGGSLASVLDFLQVSKLNSYLVDMIGNKIGPDNLSLVDDAILPSGVLSRSFDAEGAPSTKTRLIKEGVLCNYLHNSYSASKSGLQNTGNAWRASYTSIPTIGPSNLILSPGDMSEDEILSETRRGVYCRFTGDLPNPISGDLNAIIMEGHYVENGEKTHPVKNTLFSMNMLELLMNIVYIGDVSTPTEGGFFPSIMIENAQVSSGKS
ncbi:MAG: TldD/PmbA family protein, partial [Candidatus Thorarchaeota archaeon]